MLCYTSHVLSDRFSLPSE